MSSVAFTDDGTRIVSGSVDGTVRVWDTVFGLSIPADQGESILAVDFSPDNSRRGVGRSRWHCQAVGYQNRHVDRAR